MLKLPRGVGPPSGVKPRIDADVERLIRNAIPKLVQSLRLAGGRLLGAICWGPLPETAQPFRAGSLLATISLSTPRGSSAIGRNQTTLKKNSGR